MATNELLIGAPQLGALRYRGGCIEIRPPQIPYPGKNAFQFDVARDLERIEQQDIGHRLLRDLLAADKLIKITYQQLNFARCGLGGLYELCYQYFSANPEGLTDEKVANRAGTYRAFGDELVREMGRAAVSGRELARQLLEADLYSWKNGTRRANPFKKGDGHDRQGQVEAQIQRWCAGDALPSNDQMDLLSQVLEPTLRPGDGSAVLISYDPLLTTGRPAEVGLFHELVHAHYTVRGTQLGREDSASEFAGGRHFELMSTGFTPHDNKPFSENRYRQAVSVPARTDYP